MRACRWYICFFHINQFENDVFFKSRSDSYTICLIRRHRGTCGIFQKCRQCFFEAYYIILLILIIKPDYPRNAHGITQATALMCFGLPDAPRRGSSDGRRPSRWWQKSVSVLKTRTEHRSTNNVGA